MSERKDKKKVVGEPMTDEQIRIFLNVEPEAGEDRDFSALLRAYRSLREHDFARFVEMFVAEGRNLDARDAEGRTLADILATHRLAEGYLAVLETARTPA